MKKLFLFITTPLVLSVLLTFITVFLLPPFNKYKLEHIKSIPITTNDKMFYHDFNHDGNCELVYYHHRFDSIHLSYVVRNDDVIIDQWHFDGEKLNGNSIQAGDFDNNNSDEIYQVVRRKDSVFLIYFEPFSSNGDIVHKFLFNVNNLIKDLHVCNILLKDLNNDGYKEIVFTITVGYSVYPRAIYAYDRFNDALIKTPNLCFALLDTFIEDINDDGIPEIFCYGGAYSNCDDTAAYSDHFSWLMVFNNKLEFLFRPVKLGVSPANLTVTPFKPGEISYLICYNGYNGYNEYPSLQLFDLKGKLIKKQELTDRENFTSAVLFSVDQKRIFMSAANGQTFEINEDLTLNFIKELKPMRAYPIIMDIDSDGEAECIILGKDYDGLTIIRKDLGHSVQTKLRMPSYDNIFSLNYQKQKPTQLVFSALSDVQYFEYSENFIFKLRFLLYLSVFLFFFISIQFIAWLQRFRLVQKQNVEKQIAELQIKSLKNQIDPHFTFNVINVIASLFGQQDTDKAFYLFDKYTKLLLVSIQNSDKIITTIEEKLSYIKDYIDLEQSRLPNEFEYSLVVEKGVDLQLQIPKMLLYTFVENSIKHGIRHLERPGLLEIIVSQSEKNCLIEIRDNGIGRQAAKELVTYGAGKGISILDEVLKCYFILKRKRITYEIIDLYKKNIPVGTLVKIMIPLK